MSNAIENNFSRPLIVLSIDAIDIRKLFVMHCTISPAIFHRGIRVALITTEIEVRTFNIAPRSSA